MFMLQKVKVTSTFCNMKFIAREGGSTRNKQSQLATQHCCLTSCTKMLPVLPGLKENLSKYQDILSSVIIFFILIASMFEQVVII